MISRICLTTIFLLIIGSVSASGFTIPEPADSIVPPSKSPDFEVKLKFRFQTLYQGILNTSDNQWSDNVMVRRARFKFEGFAYSPKLTYKLELGLSNRDIGGALPETNNAARIILDAVVKYQFANNWEVWFGQTKLPGNRERIISSQKLQFVDRSRLNSRFNLDRDIGVQLFHKNIWGNVYSEQTLSVAMGEGRNITSNNIGGYDYTARFELFPFGEFTSEGAYFGSDLAREKKPKLAFAVAYDYNSGASRPGGQLGSFLVDTLGNKLTNSLASIFIDAMFKYRGWSMMSEYVSKTVKGDPSPAQYRTGRGFNFQSGYLFRKSQLEIAARYTQVTSADNGFSALNDETEYTLGLSKYISGHNLKIQTDVSYLELKQEPNTLRYRFQVEFSL